MKISGTRPADLLLVLCGLRARIERVFGESLIPYDCNIGFS